ncbi:sugar phosphate isomerase/epimerase family protein [Segetibacter koreensis]|uniref:sugar phosphate isomerase/epimerase family protein n=1 Tax=Segetibacter koreensis TaxID=398037 RepID=UPI00037A5BB4|nr:sugar phosphate isomerase/epimerase [Segetibacter koreensis]
MDTSRRIFIKNGSITLAGSALLPVHILKEQKSTSHVLGIQLWTIKDYMEKDVPGTLKRLSQIGYRYVEGAGYNDRKFYGYQAADFKKLLNDNELKMESGHNFLGAKVWDKANNDFTDEWKNTIEDAAAVGMKYVISPGVDESLCKNADDFKWYMDLFNKTGSLCKKAGLTFAYHNENYEFNHTLNGTRLYDLLLQLTDRSLVAQQIDIGNMYEPGGRAMDYLKRYPGRFFSMHVKDEIKKNTTTQNGDVYESTVLGKGVVGVKNIVDFALKSGTKYFIIEQESFQDKSSIDCAAEDFKMMKKWGY